jgi:hypothetical protein
MARTGADALKPSCVRKMRIVAHTGQNGRNDGQQIMVDRGHAFIGHVCSRGFSVVDVRDPTKPKTGRNRAAPLLVHGRALVHASANQSKDDRDPAAE